MKFSWFHLMPYRWLPADFRERYHSVWVDLPNALYDPVRGHGALQRVSRHARVRRSDGLRCRRRERASPERVRDDAFAESHGGGAGAADRQRHAAGARELDRPLQSAGTRRRGDGHARRDVGRAPDRRLSRRHVDGHQLLLWPEPRDRAREVPRGPRSGHQVVGVAGAVRVERHVHQAALRQRLAAADPEAAPARVDPGPRLDRDLGLVRRSRRTTTAISPSAATSARRRCSTATGSG